MGGQYSSLQAPPPSSDVLNSCWISKHSMALGVETTRSRTFHDFDCTLTFVQVLLAQAGRPRCNESRKLEFRGFACTPRGSLRCKRRTDGIGVMTHGIEIEEGTRCNSTGAISISRLHDNKS